MTERIDISPVVLKFKSILDSLDINYYKVYLFGSRAKNRSWPDSDYDFFVILNEKLNREEISSLYALISEKVHEEIPGTSFDIKLRTKSDFNRNKKMLNILDYTVNNEGISI
jgi:predicted nucleotidyltransferase